MIGGKTAKSFRWLKTIVWGILLLICVILGGSVLSNLILPSQPDVVERLGERNKALLLEVLHLRRALGDSLWTGWSNAEIPVILYNEEYAFLVGCSSPPPGWRSVPHDVLLGGTWQIVPGDSLDGKHYYRQRLPDDGTTPQAFTVRIGQGWAASMTTKDWTTIKMGNEIRDHLPRVIRPFAPYRLAAKIFTGLAMNTAGYICAVEHESFHAFQGMVAANRLAEAEAALERDGRRYPWDNPAFNDGWKSELNALADALTANDERHMIEFCIRFISLRQARRLSHNLDTTLANLERLREWEEGLAKYTELALWKRAADDTEYNPVRALRNDPDLDHYRSFAGRWGQEMTTLRLQSKEGENRFYYSGMAQAFLLDHFSPRWRTQVLENNVFLEGLLEEAITLRGAYHPR